MDPRLPPFLPAVMAGLEDRHGLHGPPASPSASYSSGLVRAASDLIGVRPPPLAIEISLTADQLEDGRMKKCPFEGDHCSMSNTGNIICTTYSVALQQVGCLHSLVSFQGLSC